MGTNTKKPAIFINPTLKGADTLKKIIPLSAMLIAPQTAFTIPMVAEVPIATFIEYPIVFKNGTPSDPAPIPRGTDIKPIKIPYKFLKTFGTFFFFEPALSLKKIKKTPTQKAKKENIKRSCGVLEFVATIVPIKIPITTLTPKVFTRLKSTALYFMCDNAETIDVGIIIAKDVPMAICIIKFSSYPSFPKA